MLVVGGGDAGTAAAASAVARGETDVLVDDRPGQIARLLTEIGEIGVNLEDLRLDHSSGRNVGMVEISVLPSKHDALVAELEERGWRVLQ